MNPLTIAQFRIDFPEFADRVVYPDAMVATWLNVTLNLVGNQLRFGTVLITAQELALAHFLVLALRGQQDAAAGRTPGTPQGLVASQSVGPVSISYDNPDVVGDGGNLWNETTYGQRYYALARMFGAGGLQLGAACCAPGFDYNGYC